MLNIDKLIPHGHGLAAVLIKRAARVTLTAELCHQDRVETTDSLGRLLAIALPAGTPVHGGDVLVAADGSLIVVDAPPCGHDHAPAPATAPSRGKPIGIAVAGAPAPHVHGPGCKH